MDQPPLKSVTFAFHMSAESNPQLSSSKILVFFQHSSIRVTIDGRVNPPIHWTIRPFPSTYSRPLTLDFASTGLYVCHHASENNRNKAVHLIIIRIASFLLSELVDLALSSQLFRIGIFFDPVPELGLLLSFGQCCDPSLKQYLLYVRSFLFFVPLYS